MGMLPLNPCSLLVNRVAVKRVAKFGDDSEGVTEGLEGLEGWAKNSKSALGFLGVQIAGCSSPKRDERWRRNGGVGFA